MNKIKRVSMTAHFPLVGFDRETFNAGLDSAFSRYGERFEDSVTYKGSEIIIQNSWYFDGMHAVSSDVLLRFQTYFEIHRSAGIVYLYSASKKDAVDKSKGYTIHKGKIVGEYRMGWIPSES